MDENKSARWEEFVSGLPEEDRVYVSSLTNFPDFSEWAQGKNINTLGLWRARQNFLLYGHLQTPEEKTKQGPKEKGKPFIDLGKNPPHGGAPQPTYKSFKDAAHEKAQKDAEEWNKTRDPSKAMGFYHAYEISLQKSYDEFAEKHEGLVRGWTKKPRFWGLMSKENDSRDRRFDTSLRRIETKKEARKKGLPIPDFSWKPTDDIAQRIKLLEKRAALKTGLSKSTDPKEFYKQKVLLLENLRQEKSQAFAEYVFNTYGRGKITDPALAEVVKKATEQKTGEVITQKKAIENAQRRYEEHKPERVEWSKKTFPPKPTPPPKKRGVFGLPRLRRRMVSAPVSETPITTGTVNVANRVFSGGGRGFPKGIGNPLSRFTRNLGIPNPFSRITSGVNNLFNPLGKINPVSLVEKQILRMLFFSIFGIFGLTFLLAAVALGGMGGFGTGAPEETTISPSPSPGEPAPSGQPPPGPPGEGNSEIAYWAQQVSNSLGKGDDGLFNVLLQPIFGRVTIPAQGGFLCTDLTKASYRLAGVPGPTSASTCQQARGWRSLGTGYRIEGKDVDVRNIKEGDIMWWYTNQPTVGANVNCGEFLYTFHTNVITEITITDSNNGVGVLITRDANNWKTKFDYPIRNWNVANWPIVKGGGKKADGFWVGIAPVQ